MAPATGSVTRAALPIVLATAGFLLASWALAQIAPERDIDEVGLKLRYFEASKDRYDIVFFGSSLVLRGVVPKVFDAELHRRGFDLRSFNFAVGGMFAHETNALIRRVLDLEPRRLRFVVVQFPGWNPTFWPNEFTGRMISWHDLPETRSALRSTWLVPNTSWADRVELSWAHGLHFLARQLPVGRAHTWIDPESSSPPLLGFGSRDPQVLAEHEGHLPYPRELMTRPELSPRRSAFLKELEAYAERVREREAQRPGPPAAYNLIALAEQMERIQRAGAEPVYLLTPRLSPEPGLRALVEDGTIPRALAFDDPAAHPELYEPESRFDAHHLSAQGAARFSTLLADRFAERILGVAPSDGP